MNKDIDNTEIALRKMADNMPKPEGDNSFIKAASPRPKRRRPSFGLAVALLCLLFFCASSLLDSLLKTDVVYAGEGKTPVSAWTFGGISKEHMEKKFDVSLPDKIGSFGIKDCAYWFIIPRDSMAIFTPFTLKYTICEVSYGEKGNPDYGDLMLMIGKTDNSFWRDYYSFDDNNVWQPNKDSKDSNVYENAEFSEIEMDNLRINVVRTPAKYDENGESISADYTKAIWLDGETVYSLHICTTLTDETLLSLAKVVREANNQEQ